ncbi:MAG TPA: hypothetical protein VFN26_12680 [Candidatus Acidoferrum sp.]|nr:hypothetical protein [Candidatus Acidoferrum sp.]
MKKCGKLRRQSICQEATAGRRTGFFRADGEANSLAEVRACSACAGDYEDPDRTAWTPDVPDEVEGAAARDAGGEEFPAEE